MEYLFILLLAAVIAILIYAFAAKRIGMSFLGWLISLAVSFLFAITSPLWILQVTKNVPPVLAILIIGVIVCVLSMLFHVRNGKQINKTARELSIKSNKSHPMNPKYNLSAKFDPQKTIVLEDYIMDQLEPSGDDFPNAMYYENDDYAAGYSGEVYQEQELTAADESEAPAEYGYEDVPDYEYYPVYSPYQDIIENPPAITQPDIAYDESAENEQSEPKEYDLNLVDEIVDSYSGRVEEFLSDILNIDLREIEKEFSVKLDAPKPLLELETTSTDEPVAAVIEEEPIIPDVIYAEPVISVIEEIPEEEPITAELIPASAIIALSRSASRKQRGAQTDGDIVIQQTNLFEASDEPSYKRSDKPSSEAVDYDIALPDETPADSGDNSRDDFEQLLMLAFNAKMTQNWDDAADLFTKCKSFDLSVTECQMIDIEILNALIKAKRRETAIHHLFALLANNYPFTQAEKDELTTRMHKLSGEEAI